MRHFYRLHLPILNIYSKLSASHLLVVYITYSFLCLLFINSYLYRLSVVQANKAGNRLKMHYKNENCVINMKLEASKLGIFSYYILLVYYPFNEPRNKLAFRRLGQKVVDFQQVHLGEEGLRSNRRRLPELLLAQIRILYSTKASTYFYSMVLFLTF